MIFHKISQWLERRREAKALRRKNEEIHRKQWNLRWDRQRNWPPKSLTAHLPPGMRLEFNQLFDLVLDTRRPDNPYFGEFGLYFDPDENLRSIYWGIAEVLEAEEKQFSFATEYAAFLEEALGQPQGAALAIPNLPDDLSPYYLREGLDTPYTEEEMDSHIEKTEEKLGKTLTLEERRVLPLEMSRQCIRLTHLLWQVRPRHRDQVKIKIRKVILILVEHYQATTPEHEQLRDRLESLKTRVSDRHPDLPLHTFPF